MNRAILITSIVLATALLVALVQGWNPRTSEEQPEALAASFSLTDVETGEQITLSDYEDDTLVIHVFAGWCALCTGTARSIAAYDDDFSVLLISADGRESDLDLISFKERHGRADWRVARLTPEFERDYSVRSLDTKYVIRDGAITYTDSRSWRVEDARRAIGESA